MKNQQIKKLAFAALLIALGVVCSSFAIPVGASKCLPTQHAVNVLAGVFLGPVYSCSMAFITSLIRLMLGTGSLLAFPGSMIGALLCGLAFKYGKRLWCAFAGEVFGTGILGALAAYPVAVFLLGKEAAVFAYVLPFLISTVGGSILSVVFIKILEKTHVMSMIQNSLGTTVRQKKAEQPNT
ncbi:energy coupling factor transporter S component ThiW [Massiliimalia massiliensis]|jgi:energy coupling factor transporter S component ThiW|uniref:energy coupling factor transporter S component ThiW n=1 Tax=Massiliimalia massiliensis TaxID=1852384 RepID=UPI000986835A|nr:energy coupling factor transporter S component ThiW [Massiliimalia massiliensis]MBS1474286.1 energy coupling factor transporter S component ThiW [Massiliimalia sp.]